MTRIKAVLIGHPNTIAFAIGLVVLCASVAHWSGPLAGAIAGGTLMAIGAWPIVARRTED